MSTTLSAIGFLLSLLDPIGAAHAATCTLKSWSYSSSYIICFFDCAGEQKTHVINSTETCPDTIDKK